MSAIQQLLLAGGDTIRLTSATITRDNPGGATATWRIDADGQVYGTNGAGAIVALYNWVTPVSSAPNYDVRWSTTSGVVDSTPGAEATNLPLTSDRTWSETNATTIESCVFQASIHRTGDTTTPLATATVTLEVDGSP
jgi:hypothetical protein